jgi:hypothetical protein
MTGGGEHGRDVVIAEVRRGQHDAIRPGSYGPQPVRLIGLGSRMIELDEPGARRAKPQRPVVVPGAADHHLACRTKNRKHRKHRKRGLAASSGEQLAGFRHGLWLADERYPAAGRATTGLPGSGVGCLALPVRHRQQLFGVSLAELGLFQAAQHPGQLAHPGRPVQPHHAALGDQPVT